MKRQNNCLNQSFSQEDLKTIFTSPINDQSSSPTGHGHENNHEERLLNDNTEASLKESSTPKQQLPQSDQKTKIFCNNSSSSSSTCSNSSNSSKSSSRTDSNETPKLASSQSQNQVSRHHKLKPKLNSSNNQKYSSSSSSSTSSAHVTLELTSRSVSLFLCEPVGM